MFLIIFFNEIMLNIYMFYAKVINKIFCKCLCFLIVVINNNNNKTINRFENFINYKSFINLNKHVRNVQFFQ